MNKVYKNSRHVRWNWEQSPENLELVRYHFVVVDDRGREEVMGRILSQLAFTGGVERIRHEEGKVEGTRFRYLFESYDCATASRMIDWTKVRKSAKRDMDLREREIDAVGKKGNIEDYVASVYG